MKSQIIMLGVGHGAVRQLFNTCFVIKNEKGNFLVDSGGGIEILNRLERVGVDYESLQNIFISHCHSDHLLGLIWYFKRMYKKLRAERLPEKVRIYCNEKTKRSILAVAESVLQPGVMDAIAENYDFVVLRDGDKHEICGVEYEFFDTHASVVDLCGFECVLNGKRVVFMGDETIAPELYDRVRGADYVMHEAFCMDADVSGFRPKHHATVGYVCEVMEKLGVKNLVLYHTDEAHGEDRQALFVAEGRQKFSGGLLVPNELEEVEII